jgi:DNA (cytosine-5)-methyltransferase 1
VRHLDLFSGIGGFALAARWMGWETVAFCEIEPYCRKILAKNFPGVPIHDDIRTFDTSGLQCDIVTGGFPCQPFSSASAGKRRGVEDHRYLWPEMLRVVLGLDPAWVCIENVPHLDGVALEQVVSDLEACRYETATLEIPACAIGQDHRRSRLWILGHSDSDCESGLSVDAEMAGVPWRHRPAGGVGSADGISSRMDRLRALGNAIVPQVALEIFRALEVTARDALLRR